MMNYGEAIFKGVLTRCGRALEEDGAVGRLRGDRLKLIVIAGPPFILSRVVAAPALPCEPPQAASSARGPPHHRPRRYDDSGGMDVA
jgi:hypothetical protein